MKHPDVLFDLEGGRKPGRAHCGFVWPLNTDWSKWVMLSRCSWLGQPGVRLASWAPSAGLSPGQPPSQPDGLPQAGFHRLAGAAGLWPRFLLQGGGWAAAPQGPFQL